MRVVRLLKARHAASALDGEGARKAGGRWNAPGVPVVYCATSLSLAVLELLVPVDALDLPDDLLALQVELPEDLPTERLLPGDLPSNWRQEAGRAALRGLGAAWLKAGSSAALFVPSVVVPAEWNLLINPRHPGAARIRVADQAPFTLDPRLY
jgi:RES domain-containing protein